MKVEDGKFVCSTKRDHEKALEQCEEWGVNPYMDVENPVSSDFRGYYFAGVIGFIHRLKMYPNLAKMPLNYRNEGVALTDVYHDLLKKDFNGIHIQIDPERIESYGRSIAVKNSKKFMAYIGRISEHTEENYDIAVPTPEEYKMYRDKLMYDKTGKEFEDWYVSVKGETTDLMTGY